MKKFNMPFVLPTSRALIAGRHRQTARAAMLAVLLACMASAQAATAIDRFVANAFQPPPNAAMLWLTPEIKTGAKQAAGFAPDGARLRYWRSGPRTAWVLDRIGKEAPITFGVIVENNVVVSLQVLTYRETRGHEIRSTRWLAQFNGVRADDSGKANGGLDRNIDNITGATLSVRASRDVARLALYLHSLPAP